MSTHRTRDAGGQTDEDDESDEMKPDVVTEGHYGQLRVDIIIYKIYVPLCAVCREIASRRFTDIIMCKTFYINKANTRTHAHTHTHTHTHIHTHIITELHIELHRSRRIYRFEGEFGAIKSE